MSEGLNNIELSSIILASTAILGLIAKFVHSLRGEIRECWGVKFRTPPPSRQVSENNNAGFHYQNTQNIPVVPTLPIVNDNNLMNV